MTHSNSAQRSATIDPQLALLSVAAMSANGGQQNCRSLDAIGFIATRPCGYPHF
jgi:hypothetical protein